MITQIVPATPGVFIHLPDTEVYMLVHLWALTNDGGVFGMTTTDLMLGPELNSYGASRRRVTYVLQRDLPTDATVLR